MKMTPEQRQASREALDEAGAKWAADTFLGFVGEVNRRQQEEGLQQIGEYSAGELEAVVGGKIVTGGVMASIRVVTKARAALKWETPSSTPTFGHTFKTHGAGVKNTKALLGRAKGPNGGPQGQWKDNDAAAAWLKEQRTGLQGPVTVPLPAGLGQVVKLRFGVKVCSPEEWPVTVQTDLVVLLEQMPDALDALSSGRACRLEFFEQGVERIVEIVPGASEVSVYCRDLIETPESAVATARVSRVEVVQQLCGLAERFAYAASECCAEGARHPRFVLFKGQLLQAARRLADNWGPGSDGSN